MNEQNLHIMSFAPPFRVPQPECCRPVPQRSVRPWFIVHSFFVRRLQAIKMHRKRNICQRILGRVRLDFGKQTGSVYEFMRKQTSYLVIYASNAIKRTHIYQHRWRRRRRQQQHVLVAHFVAMSRFLLDNPQWGNVKRKAHKIIIHRHM